MGVTILQQYPVKDRTGLQTIEYLSKRVMALGAKSAGHFLVDCETYVSVPQLGPQRTMHVLHNSEYPASVFAALETGTKTIPVVADSLLDLLLVKMTSVYTSKKQTKIEIKGPRFELCDFSVKIGSVSMSQNFKGVLLEIEYKPSMVAGNCWELLKEFVQGFLKLSTITVPPQYLQTRMNDIYQPMDTMQQYLEHFILFKKSTGILQYS